MHLYKLTERVIHEGYTNIVLASDKEYTYKDFVELIDSLKKQYEKQQGRYGWLRYVSEELIEKHEFYEPKMKEYESFIR